MIKRRRSSHFAILCGFSLVALVGGLVLAGRAGASPSFAFFQTVGDLFKGSKGGSESA